MGLREAAIVVGILAVLGALYGAGKFIYDAGYASRDAEVKELRDARQADADKRAKEIEEQKAASAAEAAARAAEVASYGATDSARALCFDGPAVQLFNAGPGPRVPVPGSGPAAVRPGRDSREGEVRRPR